MKLLEGRNWVYTTHMLFVSPILLVLPLAVIYQKEWNLSDNFINMLMYLFIGLGVGVFLYHGSKLRINL